MSDDKTPASAEVSPGDMVAGYRLEEQIGQGGMAVVYRAHDERLDRQVALKLLAPGLAADTAFRTRFIRESRAAAAVDHPNVIPVYDAGDAGNVLFIAMRYVNGGDVRSLIADHEPLPPARAWNIISQVAAALDAAHERNLIHRDVKPANMLLDGGGRTDAQRRRDTGDGPQDHVYLSDFGISKQSFASHLTSTGQFVGTLDYIAPEQIEGHGIDGRTDQYSLACTAFELLSGGPPYERSLGLALINAHLSENPPSLVVRRPELPSNVDLVMAKAMAKAPARRYPTCSAFAADLGRALGLAQGPLEVSTPVPGGPGADDTGQVRPWPATELAQTPPGGTDRIPDQSAQGTVAAVPGAGQAQWPAELAGSPHAAAQPGMAVPGMAAQPGMAVPGMAVPGMAGQPGLAGQAGIPGQAGPGGQQWPAGTWPTGGGGGQAGPYGQHPQYPTYPPGGAQTGPGWPGYPPGQPPKRSRAMLIGILTSTLVIAAAAIVVAKIVVGSGGTGRTASSTSTISTTPPTSSSPPVSPVSSTAQSQADAVASLLQNSTSTHTGLQAAVLDIEDNCQYLSAGQFASDVSTIQSAASQRQSEYTQAQSLDMSALPSGGNLKSELMDALSHSLQADNDFVTWAQQEQAGCFVSNQSAAYVAAGSESQRATAAKQSFASLWNSQIVPAYNEPTIDSGSL